MFTLLMLGMGMLLGQDVAAAVSSGDILFANDYLTIIVKVIGIVVVSLFGWLAEKARRKGVKLGIDEEVWDAAETAITRIYHTTYASFKKASEDAKITKHEAAQMREEAFDLVKEELKGPALAFVKNKGAHYMAKITENIISRFKGQKKGSAE